MYENTLLLIVSFVCVTSWFVSEVSGEICSNGQYCDDYDYQYCCSEGCCYDYSGYSYWNLWYFWFIVIFILMTCFGGCGYYRRRQVYLHSVSGQRIPVGQTTYLTSGVHPNAVPVTVHHTHPPATVAGAFQSPPPYSEVTSKPQMYPMPVDPAYPPQAAGYPPQAAGYPPQAAPYPNQAGYYQAQPYPYPAQPLSPNQPPPEYIPPQSNPADMHLSMSALTFG